MGQKRIIPPKEDILQYYIQELHTKKESALHFGVSVSTFSRWLLFYEITKDREQLNKTSEESFMKKYGVTNPAKLEKTKQKIKNTNVAKYGYDNPSKHPVVRDKISVATSSFPGEEVFLAYYIKDNHSQAETAKHFNVSVGAVQSWCKKYKIKKNKRDIVEKRKQTNLERYGYANPLQNEEIKKKATVTSQQNYGVDNPASSEVVKTKIVNTCLDKYGSPSYLTSEEGRVNIQNKIKEKYGVNYPRQIPLPQEVVEVLNNKRKMKLYLANNFAYKPTMTELARKLNCSETAVFHAVKRLKARSFFSLYRSTLESETNEFLESLGIRTVLNVKDLMPNHYEVDIYCPDYSVAIELNGDYWHSDLQKDKKYHFHKTQAAESVGVRLIHIYEHEWRNPVIQNILKSYLRIVFGRIENKVYARDCEVREITNKEAKPFNNLNHLQGHRNAQITLGLFKEDTLVQLMSFSRHRKYEWEIVRGCPGSNNLVVGGVSKLFTHFIREYAPQSVFSYCDYNKFNGKSYEALGMTFIGYTGPDLKYVINGEVVNRNPKKYRENNSQCEYKIWGAGSKKYLWQNK